MASKNLAVEFLAIFLKTQLNPLISKISDGKNGVFREAVALLIGYAMAAAHSAGITREEVVRMAETAWDVKASSPPG